MSLLSLLNIARSALLSHQRMMSVIGHNVANAQTPGYSRQRLELQAGTPVRMSFGSIGTGVTTVELLRLRDEHLDLSFRNDQGQLGDAGARLSLLGRVNDATLDPTGDGVGAAFDELVQSFGDLASEPSSGPLRELVRSAAQRFTSQLHRMNSAIDDAEAEARTALTSQVDRINAITTEIATINRHLDGSADALAPDLLDRRDQLLDELAGYGDVRVQTEPSGALTVLLGAQTLVHGDSANTVEMRGLTGGGWGVAIQGATGTFDAGHGSVQAIATLTATTLPGMRARLDAYAEAAVVEFNNVHRAGYGLNGGTNVDFFDGARTTAGTITVSAAVLATTDAIAAAATAAPGDADNALALAALGGLGVASLGGRTLRDHYAMFVADVGAQTQTADRDVVSYQTLLVRDDARRQSVSGVSVDEEMVQMIGVQQAYSAAARLVKVADDMVQELLNIV